MKLRISQKILFSLLGVAILSVATFSILMFISTIEILEQNITREIKELTAESARGLENLVRKSETTLYIIAQSPGIRDLLSCLKTADDQHLREALRRVETVFMNLQDLDNTIQAVRFINTAGYVLVKVKEGSIIPRNGPVVPGLGLRAVSSKKGRDFFKNTVRLKVGEDWISNMERGWMEGAKEWCPAMVRFSTPLFFSNGERAGIVIINVWGKIAGERINRLISPEAGYAFLIEKNLKNPIRNGIYLFHQDSQCEFGNQTGSHINIFEQYPPSVTNSWMSQAEGININPDSGDIVAHHFYSPYHDPERGWVLVVNAGSKFFMAPLSAIKTRIFLFAGLVLALTLLATFFISRSLTRPIQEVADGVHSISKDLGSRIRIKSSDEIGVLAGEINRMASSLQQSLEENKKVEEKMCQSQKLASIGEMASGLAHELNTPLGNIRALSSLVKKDLESGKADETTVRDDILDILGEVDRCSRIIVGLLSFARPQSPKCKFLDINDLLEETLSLIRMKSEKKKVTVILEKNDCISMLMIDGHQIQQVFVNILLNALSAVEQGGRVLVSSKAEDGRLLIRFEDNGSGIRPEHLRSIFNPFFTTKEVGKGTGLGLSVSYGIIKNHGGTIEVESEWGKGSVFTVALLAGDHKDDKNIGS